MEHFIVSARKYRPSGFDQVVGQKAITQTLDNAIASNHLAQALLFTGPRGVGKTTCARILAKKINQNGTNQSQEDFAFNIFELDAASNNSVEDIRSLIDQVRIPPQTGRFKVYIIDEVHMLSSAAFNAFLKTLEEPPSHAIFILATTEKHKIIPTILSRCQIFDFKRITVNDIKDQLKRVAQAEGIDAEDDALHLMALKADGAMRDALSIFDRIVSFCGNSITRTAVAENLHILDYAQYFAVTDFMLEGRIPELLLQLDQILAQGFDGQHFINGLCSHFRDLLVSQTPETIKLLQVGDNVKQAYTEQSTKADKTWLMTGLDLANECAMNYKNSRNQRLLVELCLMQLASLKDLDQKKKSSNQPYIIPASELNSPAKTSPEAGSSALEASSPSTATETVSLDAETPSPETAPQVIPSTSESPSESPSVESVHTKNPAQKTSTTSPPRPQIDIPLDSGHKGVSSLSLKSIAQKKKIEENQEATQPDKGVKRNSEITQEAFLEAWNQYAENVKNEGKFNLHSHLTMGVPQLKGTEITLIYPNDTIRLEVEREQGDILMHLANTLNNDHLSFNLVVEEQAVKRYAYTPEEKYEQLKTENPLLEVLRGSLDLDL